MFGAKIWLFLEIWVIIKDLKIKLNFSENPGHDILVIYWVSVEVWFTTSKTGLDLQYNRLFILIVSQFAKPLNTKDLRKLRNDSKYQNLRLRWRHRVVSVSPPEINFLTVVVKFCQILPDFLNYAKKSFRNCSSLTMYSWD